MFTLKRTTLGTFGALVTFLLVAQTPRKGTMVPSRPVNQGATEAKETTRTTAVQSAPTSGLPATRPTAQNVAGSAPNPTPVTPDPTAPGTPTPTDPTPAPTDPGGVVTDPTGGGTMPDPTAGGTITDPTGGGGGSITDPTAPGGPGGNGQTRTPTPTPTPTPIPVGVDTSSSNLWTFLQSQDPGDTTVGYPPATVSGATSPWTGGPVATVIGIS